MEIEYGEMCLLKRLLFSFRLEKQLEMDKYVFLEVAVLRLEWELKIDKFVCCRGCCFRLKCKLNLFVLGSSLRRPVTQKLGQASTLQIVTKTTMSTNYLQ